MTSEAAPAERSRTRAPLRFALAALSLAFVLAACDREPPTDPAVAPTDATAAESTPAAPIAPAAPVVAPTPSSSTPVESTPAAIPAATPARAALEAFAGSSPWEAFSGIAGVIWNDAEPVPTPGALGAEDARSRSGKLAWTETAPTPAGIEPEREAGITLVGREAVESLAFRKFRPATDYDAAIRAQVGDDVALTLIADGCARIFGTRRANARGTAFYEVRIGDRPPVYLEGNADRDGGKLGPGFTTYEFTRTRPDARIADMGCVAR
ncbi:MAG: hypothetical protein ACOY82_18870 [Pseudomonadota bacterium]